MVPRRTGAYTLLILEEPRHGCCWGTVKGLPLVIIWRSVLCLQPRRCPVRQGKKMKGRGEMREYMDSFSFGGVKELHTLVQISSKVLVWIPPGR